MSEVFEIALCISKNNSIRILATAAYINLGSVQLVNFKDLQACWNSENAHYTNIWKTFLSFIIGTVNS